jgi:8-oxo-dGTP diphosphatase
MVSEEGELIVRCAGIIETLDGFLLVQSRYGEESYWIFPGGGLEPGETLEECVQREVLEEIGIEVSVEKLVFINETPPTKDSMVHFTFLCEPSSSANPSAGSDPDKEEDVIQDVRAFSINEIHEMDNFLPAEMKPVLEQAVNNDFEETPKVF